MNPELLREAFDLPRVTPLTYASSTTATIARSERRRSFKERREARGHAAHSPRRPRSRVRQRGGLRQGGPRRRGPARRRARHRYEGPAGPADARDAQRHRLRRRRRAWGDRRARDRRPVLRRDARAHDRSRRRPKPPAGALGRLARRRCDHDRCRRGYAPRRPDRRQARRMDAGLDSAAVALQRRRLRAYRAQVRSASEGTVVRP